MTQNPRMNLADYRAEEQHAMCFVFPELENAFNSFFYFPLSFHSFFSFLFSVDSAVLTQSSRTLNLA